MSAIQVPQLAESVQAVATDSLIGNELNLGVKSAQRPIYKYVQQFPQNYSYAAMSPNTTSQAVFQISGNAVYNFSKSWLEFELSVAASVGAGSANVVDLMHPAIDSVQLQTASGSTLAQYNNLGQYAKTAHALVTSKEKYFSRGPVVGGADAAGRCGSINHCCQPVNAPVGASAAVVPQGLYYYTDAGAIAGSAITITRDSGSDCGQNERQRYAISTAITAMSIKYHIPAELFSGGLLNYPKDFYSGGENLMLIVNFAAPNTYAAFAADVTITGDAVTALVANTTLANIKWVTAIEMNADYVASLKAQVNSTGMDVTIPFITSGQCVASATEFSYNVPLVPGSGNCLKRILTTYVATPVATQIINDNVDGHLYTYVQSFLDSSPLQPKKLSCDQPDQEDYQYLEHYFTNSAILSCRNFKINSFWMDNFASSVQTGPEITWEDCEESGLRIENSHNYTITFTGAQSGSLYQWLVWGRTLRIKPNGLSWVA